MYEVTIKTNTGELNLIARSHTAINNLMDMFKGCEIDIKAISAVEVNTTMEQ